MFAPRAMASELTPVLPVPAAVASPAWVVPPTTRVPCSTLSYILHAAVHPVNLFILVAGVLLARHPSFGTLATLVGVEAIYLAVLSRCGFFRRAVQKSLVQEDRQARLRARELLVLQMGDEHRNELVRIEGLLDVALAAGQRRRGAALPGCDAAGMAQLTLSYVRLAVDHQAASQALAKTDGVALYARIRSLELALLAEPLHARRLGRWLEIARRRAERWCEAHATMEGLRHQLATIMELTYLLHQDALCASNPELSSEVDTILDDFDFGDRAAREVADAAFVDAKA